MQRGKLPQELIGGSIVPSVIVLALSALSSLGIRSPSFFGLGVTLYLLAIVLLAVGVALTIRWRDEETIQPGPAPFLFALSILLVIAMPFLLMLIPSLLGRHGP